MERPSRGSGAAELAESTKDGRTRMGRKASMLGVAVAALAFVAADARAQVRIGGQLSLAEDQDLGLGPRVELDIPAVPSLTVIGSFDYFFSDDVTVPGVGEAGQDYWELNGNVVYNFLIVDLVGVEPYVGAGLNIAHRSIDFEGDGTQVDESDLLGGLNLLGGARFPLNGVTPFAEIRFEIEGGEQVPVLTGGLMFP